MCRFDLSPYMIYLNARARDNARFTGNKYSHGTQQIQARILRNGC